MDLPATYHMHAPRTALDEIKPVSYVLEWYQVTAFNEVLTHHIPSIRDVTRH